MAQKILGLDLGTNSIGIAVRNTEKGEEVVKQLEYFSSVIFPSGVGNGKSGEFSYAAQRRKNRASRRLYQARRYRKWKTLAVLIKNGYCPLKEEELKRWVTYDKNKGREYPIGATEFEQWIRLDFDGDGVPDYSSPYQLRAELMKEKLNLELQKDRNKLGRAIYHIAQRRGFKSSKGETISEQEKNAKDGVEEEEFDSSELKKSEEKKSKELVAYMEEHGCATVGCAFAMMEKEGIRVRGSEYVAVRSQYKEELIKIFDFQGVNEDFRKQILSEKEKEGSVFYKRPLRSQKGLVGKCTFESQKSRCAICHPEYEKFRAWSVLNNIRYATDENAKKSDYKELPLELRQKIYRKEFIGKARKNFNFEEIANSINNERAKNCESPLFFNYKGDQNISGCPVTYRLVQIFGKDWENWSKVTSETRKNRSTKDGVKMHQKTYKAMDAWNVCFGADEAEPIVDFAQKGLDDKEDKSDKVDEQKRQLLKMWDEMQQGYGMLSYKALKNINRMLELGFRYDKAVMLAKVPDMIGEEKWEENKEEFSKKVDEFIKECNNTRNIYKVTNNLIAKWKALPDEDKFGFKDTGYRLQDGDILDIENAAKDVFGEKSYAEMSEEEQDYICNNVRECYQHFFSTTERDYFKLPEVGAMLQDYLQEKWGVVGTEKIYHPSKIAAYQPTKEKLGSPEVGAIKNPMAMRVLHTLKNQLNELIEEGIIDSNTRVVVELAREVNDANKRWAIATYQKRREEENKIIAERLKQDYPNLIITQEIIERGRYSLIEQNENSINEKVDINDKDVYYTNTSGAVNKKVLERYRLWMEQNGVCIYTGKTISIGSLFTNDWDIEHTLPQSKSYDNSLSNKTLCDSHYNRFVKKNQLPTECPNYNNAWEGYSPIKPRLEAWQAKVKRLENNVEFWRKKSKLAQDKATKDDAIRQRLMWQMELDYWRKKVGRFTQTEVKEGFLHSQLVDTRIISRYAYLYLKSYFEQVDVQNGSATAAYRKMLGIQSVEEKKNRGMHSHHAIDATVLTLIPNSARREKMLKEFSLKEETEGDVKKRHEQELNHLIESCNFKGASDVVTYIEENILVQHIARDKALTPAKRYVRVRGKKLKSSDGQYLVMQGDSIRGELHNTTYYGAIKYPLLNANGKPEKENGSFIYEKDKDGNDLIYMVVRFLLNDKAKFSKDSDLDKIIDPNVRESIRKVCAKRVAEGNTFSVAISTPMWLLDADGNEIKKDKDGRNIAPLRHVRCKVPAGRGFMSKEKSIAVRKQIYKSAKDYKQYVYAQNGGNYLCLLYEGCYNGKFDRKIRFVTYFDAAKLGISSYKGIEKEPFYQTLNDGKKTYQLKTILRVETKVLMWKEKPDELYEMDKKDLNKRLFVVYKFNATGSEYIYLRNHIEAREDGEIGKPETSFSGEKYQALLMLSSENCNFMIEGYDFNIKMSSIEFVNHD